MTKPLASTASVDLADSRSVFEQVAEPLRPRSNENDRAYAGLLLWGMMSGDAKSKRLLGRAMDVQESTIRYWHKKHSWNRRLTICPNAEFEALRAYRLLMDLQGGKKQSEGLMVALDVVLERAGLAEVRHLVLAQRQGQPLGAPSASTAALGGEAGGEATSGSDNAAGGAQGAFEHPSKHERDALKSRVVGGALSDVEIEQMDPTKHLAKLRNDILSDHLRVVDVKRQIGLIDACLAYIAKQLRDGQLKVDVKDIPSLLRARALLTGLPTEQVAVAVNHQHDHEVTVVESQRIRNARKQGGTAFIQAMKTEYEELGVIMDAIPVEASNE